MEGLSLVVARDAIGDRRPIQREFIRICTAIDRAAGLVAGSIYCAAVIGGPCTYAEQKLVITAQQINKAKRDIERFPRRAVGNSAKNELSSPLVPRSSLSEPPASATVSKGSNWR